MPDKAIDLVDEACANVRVQLDSVPEEIDVLRRQKYRLDIEERAISKEKDKVSPACPKLPLPDHPLSLAGTEKLTPLQSVLGGVNSQGLVHAVSCKYLHASRKLTGAALQASKERLDDVRRELRDIEERLKPQELRYQAEHGTLEELRGLQRKRDELKVKLAEAENRLDMAMVADIR